MSIKKLLPIIGVLAGLVGYSYYQSQQRIKQPKKPQYHYQIHKENIRQAVDGSAMININHQYNQSSLVFDEINTNSNLFVYEIQLHNGKKFIDYIEQIDHQKINSIVDDKKPSDIKFAVLRSQTPLNITSKNRLLQSVATTNDPFINFGVVFFSKIFGFLRNLIILGLFTNTFDILFPLIIFSESVSMIGFWTNEKHFLQVMFTQIHNSNFDLFNIVRKAFTTNPDIQAIQILQTYGYSSDIFFNISGEFLITIALLIVTIIIKVLNIFAKFEKVRFLNSKLRPIWNGYVFCIMPRIAIFIGFQTRNIFEARFIDILNAAIAAVLLGGLIYYFVQLILQVRKMNERVEYLQEAYLEVGLSRKLSFEKQFDFDCLHYSMLHYPAMNFARLMFFFIPIGASHDLHYLSYGAPIASQIFFIMIGISSSGYQKTRDKVLHVIADFLFIIICLALIAVGLAQSVNHSEISIIAENAFFSVVLATFSILTLLLLLDIYSYYIYEKCIQKDNKQKQEDSDQKLENFEKGNKNRRRFAKHTKTKQSPAKNSDSEQNSSNSQQSDQQGNQKINSKRSDKISEDSDQSHKTKQRSMSSVDNDSTDTIKKNYKLPQTKVQKVKKGKVI